jgi:2,3-bisphosphoglycerate-independent phosphoglycerate mutase
VKPAPMWDDRTPMILITFDGLGDRPADELGYQTPLEAARTPNLDELTRIGVSGIHQPFGPGIATSSERSHWAMFGQTQTFPGRALLEATGMGIEITAHRPHFHLALRPAEIRDGQLHAIGRVSAEDASDCLDLFDALRVMPHELNPVLHPLRNGECILESAALSSHEISDSDPLFGHLHPVLKPLPLDSAIDQQAAQESAALMTSWLSSAVKMLQDHPVNKARREIGKLELIAPVTKWASFKTAIKSFEKVTGLTGAAVTSSALYRGLAATLEMTQIHIPSDLENIQEDFEARILAGIELSKTHSFVHIHTKATDEAGHTKSPSLKRDVIESLDRACHGLLELAKSTTIVITGDHATPSTGGIMHSAHPTSLILAGPHVHPDEQITCGESSHKSGDLGKISASDILPLMSHYSHRASFKGHATGSCETIALPDNPIALDFSDTENETEVTQINRTGIK